MIILGVCNANASGATLIIDGQMVASVNEERFTRVKNHRTFPHASIAYCLKAGGVDLAEVDAVACGAWGGLDETFLIQLAGDMMAAVRNDPTAAEQIDQRVRTAVESDRAYRQELHQELHGLGFARDKVFCYDHHTSHAYTAFFPSPFEQALVVTMDGRGDFKSATVWLASRTGGLRLLDSVSLLNSIGMFYAFITRFLGFTPDRHEGKVTGLAAAGDPGVCRHVLEKMIGWEGRITARPGRYYTPFTTGTLPALEEELARFRREDVAAAAQALTEEIVCAYVRKYLAATSQQQVCMAGGVFSNVRLNQKIMELPEVENVFIFPNMGDGGNAFGGALIHLYAGGGKLSEPLQHVYWGPAYSSGEISRALDEYRGQIEVVPLEWYGLHTIARELAEGSVIGLFTGRCEYGPRALGARSILARATDPSVTRLLNARLHRSDFMPFAPVTLESFASTFYKNWQSDHIASRFMTVCYHCTARAREQTPAIVHFDGTARPQVLSARHNRLYFDLISEYFKLTDIPTLINTSFNNHEEPIVCSPKDAIRSLLLGNVDYVIMEDNVVYPISPNSQNIRQTS